MSERGVFAIDRGIWDHPVFADEPFTEREAWQWLIGAAAFKQRSARVGAAIVALRRGQAAFSIRFCAEKWQWSKSRVHRFLDRLEKQDMIGTETGTAVTIITICNYDKYQRVSLPDRDSSGTETGTAAGQQRDKEEDIKNIKTDSEANASAPAARDDRQPDDVARETPKPIYTDSKHELWGEGVPILVSLGCVESSARSNIGRWLKDTREDAATVLGAIQRARDVRAINPIPWITRALQSKGPKNESSGTSRTDCASRPSQGDTAILTGVGKAFARRYRDEFAAGGRHLRGHSDTAAGVDANGSAAGGNFKSPRQLELVADRDPGKRPGMGNAHGGNHEQAIDDIGRRKAE